MRGALFVVSVVNQALPLIELIVIMLITMVKQMKNDETSYTRASNRPAGPS